MWFHIDDLSPFDLSSLSGMLWQQPSIQGSFSSAYSVPPHLSSGANAWVGICIGIAFVISLVCFIIAISKPKK